jgi:hypothetical protein
VAFIGLRDVVSAFVSRWELAMGILTIIVCFKFRGGVWGTIQLLGGKLKGLRGRSSAQSA